MTTHPVPTPSADELVRRLREIGNHGDNITYPSRSSAQRLRAICSEAAARILALESQLARMGEALSEFVKWARNSEDVDYLNGDSDSISGDAWEDLEKLVERAEALSSTPVQPDTGIREAALEEAALRLMEEAKWFEDRIDRYKREESAASFRADSSQTRAG